MEHRDTSELVQKLIGFFQKRNQNKKAVTRSTLECFIEETQNQRIELRGPLLKSCNFQETSICLQDKEKTESDLLKIQQHKAHFENISTKYGKGMLFFIDEVGIQLFFSIRKIRVLRHDNKSSNDLIVDRNTKISDGILCVDGNGVLLQPFLKEIPQSPKESSTKKTVGHFTKKDFRDWLQYCVISEITTRLNQSDNKNLVGTIVLPMSYQELLEGLNFNKINFYFIEENLQKECNHSTQKIYEIINHFRNKKIGIDKITTTDIINEIRNEILYQRKVVSNTNSVGSEEVKELMVFKMSKEAHTQFYSILSNLRFNKRAITLNTIKFILKEYCNVDQNIKEIEQPLLKIGYGLKKVRKEPIQILYDKAKINIIFDKFYKFENVQREWIYTFDVFDFRLFTGNGEEVIVSNNDEYDNAQIVGRETMNSTIGVCIAGNGDLLPYLCCVNNGAMKEEIMKQYDEIWCDCGNDFVSRESVINYLRCSFISYVDLKKKMYNYSNTTLLVLPQFFERFIKNDSLMEDLSKNNISIVYIDDDMWDFTPLGSLFDSVTNNIILKNKGLLKTNERTGFEGKKRLIEELNNIFYCEDNIVRAYYNSRFYDKFRSLTLQSLTCEIGYLATQYEQNFNILIQNKHTLHDPPLTCFFIKMVDPFYRGAVKEILNSPEFLNCKTKTEQINFLKQELPDIIMDLENMGRIKEEIIEPKKRPFIE